MTVFGLTRASYTPPLISQNRFRHSVHWIARIARQILSGKVDRLLLHCMLILCVLVKGAGYSLHRPGSTTLAGSWLGLWTGPRSPVPQPAAGAASPVARELINHPLHQLGVRVISVLDEKLVIAGRQEMGTMISHRQFLGSSPQAIREVAFMDVLQARAV